MSRNLSDEIADGIVSAVLKIGITVVMGVFSLYALYMLLAFHDHIPAAIRWAWAAIGYAAESAAKLIGILVLVGLILFWGILKCIDIMNWRAALERPDCTHRLDKEDVTELNRRALPTSIEEDSVRIEAIRRVNDFDAKDGPQ